MFNQYGWGGYLIYRFYPEPNRRVFSFGEATLLGNKVMQQVSDVETGNPDWQQIFAEWDIDYVIDVPGRAGGARARGRPAVDQGVRRRARGDHGQELGAGIRHSVTETPHHPALRDAAPAVFWLDDPQAPHPEPRLEGETQCDLAVVGAGFTGLWSALLARAAQPSDSTSWCSRRGAPPTAASGRNGGFCDASLTHGFANGLSRFADELDTLERLGVENLDAIESTVRDHGIDCNFERTGMLDVATAPWQYAELVEVAEPMRAHGYRVDVLDREAMRAEVVSPTYEGGLWIHDRTAIVNPATARVGVAPRVPRGRRATPREHRGAACSARRRSGSV